MAWHGSGRRFFSDRRLALGGISLGGFSGIFLGWFHAVGHMGPGFCARRWGWVAGGRAAPRGLHRLAVYLVYTWPGVGLRATGGGVGRLLLLARQY